MKSGESLPVVLLFEGKPLAGAQIEAHSRVDGKVMTQKTTSDKDGQATVKLDRAGLWLIRLVHMRRCPEPKEADWESFWASCSFEVK